ncbi:class I SAM-dependent methyltransferase [Natronoflexus pectinivorans]|uniref:Methyltransferase family protein n=1 Tax=Natronoflexus pectinivorans TaxID=682526 RepID=A0A4R2GFY7_9BACT|nr:class I SAM-dependent methyltransferase [Natronoflexus pectinivorans]TCO07091.1 methyltransferase family protein [Natronoflexus pectinivorans]
MQFYQSIAKWYDHIFPGSPAQVKFIENAVNGLSDKHIAEIGCATGNLCIGMAANAQKVIGVDLDEELLNVARKKSSSCPNIEYIQGNMLKTGSIVESFSLDAISCIGNTLVHLQKPKDMLSFFNQCIQVLKPGGNLILQIINYDYILDFGIESLPLIENDHIKFDRRYELREQDELINFKTILTIKETKSTIINSIPLYPLRQELLNKLLNEAGFLTAKYYGGFDGSPLRQQSLHLVAHVTC